jgi:hypothetical protein
MEAAWSVALFCNLPNSTSERARPASHLRLQAKGVVGAGLPSFIFNVRKKPHASRVGLPRRVTKAREASCTHTNLRTPSSG